MMENIPVSVVSYLNSIPFIYGLEHSGYARNFSFSKDIPSVCADKLFRGEVSIGLIPSAEMLRINPHYNISDLCIGADGIVDSVILASSVPVSEIQTIYMDYHSRTSVLLARILASGLWNIRPEYIPLTEEADSRLLSDGSAVVAIGDKTFNITAPYIYDLSEQWMKYTGLPFVFACWISRIKMPEDLQKDFNKALHWGVEHIEDAIAAQTNLPCSPEQALLYLTRRIDYAFDTPKQKALELFHQMIRTVM
jgi:chorismate dehydratase